MVESLGFRVRELVFSVRSRDLRDWGVLRLEGSGASVEIQVVRLWSSES